MGAALFSSLPVTTTPQRVSEVSSQQQLPDGADAWLSSPAAAPGGPGLPGPCPRGRTTLPHQTAPQTPPPFLPPSSPLLLQNQEGKRRRLTLGSEPSDTPCSTGGASDLEDDDEVLPAALLAVLRGKLTQWSLNLVRLQPKVRLAAAAAACVGRGWAGDRAALLRRGEIKHPQGNACCSVCAALSRFHLHATKPAPPTPRQVVVSDYLVDAGLALFRSLRRLQVAGAALGTLPVAYLMNEHYLLHDAIACWWLAMKHSSIRTAVPNRFARAWWRLGPMAPRGFESAARRRPGAAALHPAPRPALAHNDRAAAGPCRTLMCRATGASPALLTDRELAALVSLNWQVSGLLRKSKLLE